MVLPKAADMFGDAESPLEIANRFEAYKDGLNKSAQNPMPTPGVPTMDSGPVSPLFEFQKSLGNADVQKALSPELLESVRQGLAGTDIGKDLLVGSGGQLGGTGGLNAYDLEAPAKLLAPRPTPLRNRIARRKGVGTAHQWKTITGFTGTGTGGVGLMRPGITESTATQFGQVNYLRGPKISYAGTQSSAPYIQFGVSDQVSWAAQFSGQGYQDIRQLSQTSVLYSSMLLEERMLLGGRGTSGSFAGALAAPAVGSLTTATAAVAAAPLAAEVGATANIATLYVGVTAVGVWGESVPTVVSTTGLASAGTGLVVVVPISPVAGATGYRVYAGTSNATAGGVYTGLFPAQVSQVGGQPGLGGAGAIGVVPGSGTVHINFTGGGTGGAPSVGTNPGTADSSASAQDYDGILTICTSSNAGYVKAINNTFAGADGANVGNSFSNAFASLYDSVKADPDEILANGGDRKQVSDQLKNEASASYRITVDSASQAHNAQIGTLVTGVQNEVTGKMVDLTVHPWLPQGTMPIISWSLPLPDSNISDVFAVYNVQDYMAIEWPVTQFAYETSSYWYGTFVCYAPAWCGALTNIWKA
jgi:hypothetical protein